jgi:hypothetical protein
MAETSVHQECEAGMVECFRHEVGHCPRYGGTGHRPRRRCEGCGEPAGRPSEGGKALLGLRNRRGKDQPVYCMGCHPELGGGPGMLAMLERMGA